MKGGGRGKKRDMLQLEPMLLSGLKTIKKVACGDMFTACLTGRIGKPFKANFIVHLGLFLIMMEYFCSPFFGNKILFPVYTKIAHSLSCWCWLWLF